MCQSRKGSFKLIFLLLDGASSDGEERFHKLDPTLSKIFVKILVCRGCVGDGIVLGIDEILLVALFLKFLKATGRLQKGCSVFLSRVRFVYVLFSAFSAQRSSSLSIEQVIRQINWNGVVRTT